eukprot:scaffold4460_cov101-Cyclotella_meneghiniana.AAC.1
MVPSEVLARAGDSKETLAERQRQCRWLDEIFKHGRQSSINGDPDNKTCLRRTVAVAEDRPRVINDLDSEDNGRSVIAMPCYTCPEMSVVDWSCRPMKNIELAFVMECWVQAWPWLTSVSRAGPFNMLQTCVFNALPRDNASVSSVRSMTNGQLPFDEGARYAGVPNSQAYGSNVVVYSMCNDPMSMVFACPNPLLPVDQETKKYIEHPCLSFPLGDGYLSILDAVDDIGFTHGSRWEDCELHSIKSLKNQEPKMERSV